MSNVKCICSINNSSHPQFNCHSESLVRAGENNLVMAKYRKKLDMIPYENNWAALSRIFDWSRCRWL